MWIQIYFPHFHRTLFIFWNFYFHMWNQTLSSTFPDLFCFSIYMSSVWKCGSWRFPIWISSIWFPHVKCKQIFWWVPDITFEFNKKQLDVANFICVNLALFCVQRPCWGNSGRYFALFCVSLGGALLAIENGVGFLVRRYAKWKIDDDGSEN